MLFNRGETDFFGGPRPNGECFWNASEGTKPDIKNIVFFKMTNFDGIINQMVT